MDGFYQPRQGIVRARENYLWWSSRQSLIPDASGTSLHFNSILISLIFQFLFAFSSSSSCFLPLEIRTSFPAVIRSCGMDKKKNLHPHIALILVDLLSQTHKSRLLSVPSKRDSCGKHDKDDPWHRQVKMEIPAQARDACVRYHCEINHGAMHFMNFLAQAHKQTHEDEWWLLSIQKISYGFYYSFHISIFISAVCEHDKRASEQLRESRILRGPWYF